MGDLRKGNRIESNWGRIKTELLFGIPFFPSKSWNFSLHCDNYGGENSIICFGWGGII